ncbi:MAG TPA: glucose-1-phosphate thymidylyltransferase [Deinococcales bacterium]|nr:glucose-1-phosphate thymidylyltransferase [Deinococcales bacterium]
MKGVIPAAGLGTRLRPLTYTRPKPLLKVANKSIIVYAIENLRDAGITDIALVVSDQTRLDIESVVHEVEGVKLTLIRQDEQLGLAHAVMVSQDWLGDDDFCVYLGDNLFEEGVTRYVNTFREGGSDAVVALVRVPDPRQFGVAVLDAEGRITQLVEKPKVPPSDLAIAGVYCFSKALHEVTATLKPSARGEYELTDAIAGLIQSGRDVRGLEVHGWWKDTGRPEDLLDANRLLLERVEAGVLGDVTESRLVGRVRVEEGAVVRGATIIGPAIIGAGATVKDSYIGPFTSVGANAKLNKVEVEFSVILEEAELDSVPVRLQESLIGQRARVAFQDRIPRAYRLILSDTSSVDLA